MSIVQVPTPSPTGNEVLIENFWTASTPLDLHQADGGIALPGWPARLGDGVAVGSHSLNCHLALKRKRHSVNRSLVKHSRFRYARNPIEHLSLTRSSLIVPGSFRNGSPGPAYFSVSMTA